MESNRHEAVPSGAEGPRGVRAMAIVRWALLAAVALLALSSWYGFARAQQTTASAKAAPKYQCPMHPQIVQDHPGECPICHMDLELIAPERGAPSTPTPTSTGPAGALVNSPTTSPPGTLPIHLALDRIQSIGVRTSVAEAKDLSRTVRVTATVMATDQGAAQVHVRTAGFVERISVNQTGIAVGSGAVLFSMYSPEILQAQTELLTTTQWNDAASSTNARRKLELLGMASADVDAVIEKKQPIRAIPVHAPQGGTVLKKSVVLGSYVTPEMTLYELQDLSRVYIVADVFPKDATVIAKGTPARFVPTRQPDAPIDSTIDLVYPIVEPDARTTRMRLTVDNTRAALRPGDFGTVELKLPKARAVVVPRDAVVDTGATTYVFVVGSDGVFYPRTVGLGGTEGDSVVVTFGLDGGERVVSGATFLVDSESRLQAAVKSAAPPAASAAPHAH